MQIKKVIFFTIVASVFVVACNINKPDKINQPASSEVDNLFNTTIDSTKMHIFKQQKTTLKFEKELYDFGEVKEGTKLNKKVVYTNTGNNPLVIFMAFGSCGCTTPTFSKEPLAPGASDTLDIGFNSEGRSGNQSKTVKVYANTEPAFNEFKFTVKVN